MLDSPSVLQAQFQGLLHTSTWRWSFAMLSRASRLLRGCLQAAFPRGRMAVVTAAYGCMCCCVVWWPPKWARMAYQGTCFLLHSYGFLYAFLANAHMHRQEIAFLVQQCGWCAGSWVTCAPGQSCVRLATTSHLVFLQGAHKRERVALASS